MIISIMIFAIILLFINIMILVSIYHAIMCKNKKLYKGLTYVIIISVLICYYYLIRNNIIGNSNELYSFKLGVIKYTVFFWVYELYYFLKEKRITKIGFLNFIKENLFVLYFTFFLIVSYLVLALLFNGQSWYMRMYWSGLVLICSINVFVFSRSIIKSRKVNVISISKITIICIIIERTSHFFFALDTYVLPLVFYLLCVQVVVSKILQYKTEEVELYIKYYWFKEKIISIDWKQVINPEYIKVSLGKLKENNFEIIRNKIKVDTFEEKTKKIITFKPFKNDESKLKFKISYIMLFIILPVVLIFLIY